ncbi:MAG TPA: hypothetical protein VIM16_01465 [Mucilaginibacter sp.]|jgi:hypothetical protein
MTHQHKEKEESYDSIYYIVGLLSGLFTGLVLDARFIWIPIMGLFGLLFTSFFIKLLVEGREDS